MRGGHEGRPPARDAGAARGGPAGNRPRRAKPSGAAGKRVLGFGAVTNDRPPPAPPADGPPLTGLLSQDSTMTRSLTGRTDRGQPRTAPASRRPAAPRRTRRTRRAGFSLLELIAVVTILGIIAAVVIPRISNSSVTAKKQADKQTLAELRTALERYNFDNDAYPTATEAGTDGAFPLLVTGNYLHASPDWQNYTYENSATAASGKITYDAATGRLVLTE